eukprot:scaffold14_cov380-Prasinococcus_capsulatus_cf.AAC.16
MVLRMVSRGRRRRRLMVSVRAWGAAHEARVPHAGRHNAAAPTIVLHLPAHCSKSSTGGLRWVSGAAPRLSTGRIYPPSARLCWEPKTTGAFARHLPGASLLVTGRISGLREAVRCQACRGPVLAFCCGRGRRRVAKYEC